MEKLKNNPLIKAIGTQRLVALLALIVIYLVFGIMNPRFATYNTMVNILMPPIILDLWQSASVL